MVFTLFSLFLIFFLLLLISRFILEILWSGKMVDIIDFLLNLLKLVLWPTWKECIFCHFLDGLPCRYLLSTTSLMSHLRWLFPYWFSIWMICPLVYVGYIDHLLLLYYHQFLPLCLLTLLCIFSCSYIKCVYVNKCYILFLYRSLYHYIMLVFIFYYKLCLKIYFVYEYCYPHLFLLFSSAWNISISSLSVCVCI